MKKILWLSRHHPDEGKMQELQRIMGEVDVTIDDRPFSPDGVNDIMARIQSGKFDEIVLVAPTSILDGLCRKGVFPLWPMMSHERSTFLGFDRILEIRKKFDEVSPVSGGHKRIMWLSRFAPTTRQTAELARLFGSDVVVTHRDIPNAEQTEQEFQNGGFEALVAIVPEAGFERLSAKELPLLRSEAVKENDHAKIEFRGGGGQGFRFDRYVWYRVEKVTTRL